MKKSIFLFFAAILCTMSAWAFNVTANYYVYFEKPSDWSNVSLLLGHGSWSQGYNMSKISNTNLYYWKTVSWEGAVEYYFIDATGWGGEGKSPSNRKGYASHASSKFTTNFSKYHLFNSTKSVKTSSSSYSNAVNLTQTIKVQVKDGENWVDATVVPADLKASTYALTSATAAGAKSASLTKESTTVSGTVSAAYSATVSLTCGTPIDGYVFEGWYDANGNKITSYTVSAAVTVYARFIQTTEETHPVNVSYKCGTTDVTASITEQVGVETEKSFTAPTVTGYNFTGWTVGVGMTLKAGTENDATITVVTKSSSSDYTLVANYEEVLETVYFINTNKWARVNIHKWNGKAAASSWPGEKLTASGEKIGEYDVYSYTAKQGDYANVIFNSKTSSSDGGNAQTGDLDWTAGKYYIYNYGGKSDWYTKEEAEELLVVPVVTHDIVVKAVVPEVWNSGTISIHYWGDGISAPSKPVATEKDGNWNKYTIKNVPEGTSVSVIFINGADWSNNANQTADITGITEDKCFQISAAKLDNDGKCTLKEVDCDATIEPEVDVYTMMGAGELGLSWELTTTGNDMTKQTDGTYTLVKEGLDLATTGSYEYKVVKNHNWDWSIPTGTENQTLKVDKDGTYTVTFTLSVDKKKLTANAVCTAEKEVILDCSVAGTINLVGGTSDFTDKLAMTYDKETKTYSKTFTALAAGNYQMKVVYGSDWLGYDKLTKPVPANVTEGDDKKIKFSLAEDGDVTVTYNVEKGIGLVGNLATPIPPVISYVLMGVNNDWTTGIVLTRNEANTDYEEYMLLNQPIVKATDAVKVVKLVDGEKTTYCGKTQVKDGSATCTADKDDNIILEDGKYNFYYAVTDNQVYIAKVEAPTAKSGKFSTGKYEYAEFAPGNLQYNTSNGTWYFAQNQYDYVGEANINLGDPNYKGWIDMFGWSNGDANNFGVNPSNKNDDYCGTFQDWGTKMGEEWETLSADQWKYLLNERTNASSLKQIARVGEVVGIMLFPDNWSKVQEVQAVEDDYFKVKIYNYTTAQWTDLEAAGAIFLPAAGRRTGGYGNTINKDQLEETNPANLNGGHYKYQDNTNIYCYYWTSTINETTKDVSFLHNIQALGGDKYTIGTGAIWGEKGRYGQSVRLAKVTNTLIEIGDDDNSAVITANAGKEMDVQVNRTFKANDGYYTICLPFTIDADEIGKAYQVTSISDAGAEGFNMVFSEVTELVAGQPYLIEPKDLTNPIFENVTISYTGNGETVAATNSVLNFEMVGVINGGGKTELGQYWVGDNGYFYNGDGTSTTAKLGLRVLFNITDKNDQPVNIRARVVVGENTTTGLDNITNGENTTIKVIENGQLIIIRNGEKFNAQGQRL